MSVAFCQSVSLPRTHSWRRVDRLLNSHTAPVMQARRPGTRSYNFCFRYGTWFSRFGNKAPSQTEQDTSTTHNDQTVASANMPNSENMASIRNISLENAAPTNGTTIAAAARLTTNQIQIGEASHSVSFRVPYLGTIQVPGQLVLLFVPFLWASYSIAIKWLYHLPWSLNPALFNFLRLVVTSIMVLPTFTKKTFSKPILTAGVELGFWTVFSNILQIVGLRYTAASRAAFLAQLSTVLVPLIALAVGLESRLSPGIIISAPLSVLGVALLTLDGAVPSPVGDCIMISVAFVGAGYILRSKKYSQLPTKALVASKTIFQMLFAGIFFFITSTRPLSAVGLSFAGATPLLLAVNVGLVIWAGFFIGYLSTILQMRGQAVVSASETAIIFTTNPLWAALLAVPLGERFGPKGFAGASLILLATALASGIGLRARQEKKVREVA